MTDEALKGIAAQALNIARRDIGRGEFHCVIGCCYRGEGFHRMEKVEQLVIEKCGPDWLNNGAAKNAVFEISRKGAGLLPPQATVFVVAANAFRTTKKFSELSPEEQKAIVNAGHTRHHECAKQGLFEIDDVLIAVVQTPDRCCRYTQDAKFDRPPEAVFCDQSEFDGRLKMYP